MSQDEVQSFATNTNPREVGRRTQVEPDSEGSTRASQHQGSSTIDSSSVGSTRDNERDELRRFLESLCHDYLGGERDRGQTVLRGSTAISRSKLSAERKQELQQFLLDITDKGKGVEEEGEEERRNEGRELLEQVFGPEVGNGGSGRDGEGIEGEREGVVGKVGETGEVNERGRKRLREEDLPWFEHIRSSKARLSDEILKTRKLLREYQEDIELVIQSIQSAPNGPINFPSSEWKNIVRGRAVNLNVVFGNLHTFKPVSESVGRLGPFEIRSECNEPTKRIETAAQWISAWDETIQATEVAFPHRGGELRDYGRGIRRLFDSVATNFHHRVFLYDEAVRGSVRGGEILSLNDNGAFQHLYTAYILPIGSEVSPDGKPRVKSGSDQLCRNFNRQGCSTRNCRYRHVCGICGDAQHGRVDCPQGKLGGDNKA
jgi:hypothetical protein